MGGYNNNLFVASICGMTYGQCVVLVGSCQAVLIGQYLPTERVMVPGGEAMDLIGNYEHIFFATPTMDPN